MINPIRYDNGQITTIKSGTVTSSTITKFDALDWTGGYLDRASNSTTEVRFLALEDKTTGGSGAHEDLIVLYTDGVEFEVDTNGNTAVTDRGTYVDLTDHNTIDENTSDDNVFYVTEMIGAAGDRKLRGYFVMKEN